MLARGSTEIVLEPFQEVHGALPMPPLDEEDTPSSYCDCCGPLTSLTRPVDVSELEKYGVPFGYLE